MFFYINAAVLFRKSLTDILQMMRDGKKRTRSPKLEAIYESQALQLNKKKVFKIKQLTLNFFRMISNVVVN